jgi:uncharacterized metal-binding protein
MFGRCRERVVQEQAVLGQAVRGGGGRDRAAAVRGRRVFDKDGCGDVCDKTVLAAMVGRGDVGGGVMLHEEGPVEADGIDIVAAAVVAAVGQGPVWGDTSILNM